MPPPNSPLTVTCGLTWSFMFGFPPAFSAFNGNPTLTQLSANSFVGSGIDNAGRSFTVTIDISIASCIVTISSAGTLTGSGPAWPGTKPYSSGTQDLFNGPSDVGDWGYQVEPD